MDQILTSCVGKIEILSRNSRAASRQNSNNSNSSQPANPASKSLSGQKPPSRPKSLLTNGIQNGIKSLSPSFPFFQDFFGIDHYKPGLNNDDKTLRVLLVGERNVGKSSFCSQYAKKVEYPDTDSSSRAFDGYHGEIVFKHTEAKSNRTSDSSPRTSSPSNQFSAMGIGNGNNHRKNSQNHNQNSKFTQSSNNTNFNQDSNKNYLQNITQNSSSSHQNVIDRWRIQLITMPPESEYERYRKILYSKADVCVICFSVIDAASFSCAIRKWLEELKGAGITKSKTMFLGMHRDERPGKGTNREEMLGDRIVDTGVSAQYANTLGIYYNEVNNHDAADVDSIMKDIIIQALEQD